jgi:hypothetical protein
MDKIVRVVIEKKVERTRNFLGKRLVAGQRDQ